MRFVKKVNDRGVLTLPTEVREALGVEEGDIVEFEVLGVVKKGTVRAPSTSTPSPKESSAQGGHA
ncbi:MAG TPA: AbrB/MazE/SpoVT family DNA-binding domain-containing protein [Candidatus Thermoplasmatota archaeon]|nr:AbrB/MazE/SpoVT family DNA-binding domain-containing protein [Candidatus Thermoplasmatota archaeon]